jgi:hypothetical protein
LWREKGEKETERVGERTKEKEKKTHRYVLASLTTALRKARRS